MEQLAFPGGVIAELFLVRKSPLKPCTSRKSYYLRAVSVRSRCTVAAPGKEAAAAGEGVLRWAFTPCTLGKQTSPSSLLTL